MNKTILVSVGVLVVFLVMGFWGYMSLIRDKDGNGSLEKVKVQLKWLHQAQFAGLYVADQKGFYKENGIEVELLPFDYENYPIDLVVSGKADFGIAGAEELIIARSEGLPVKALAVIFQKNPTVAYVRKDSGIESLNDFVGKRVGMENSRNIKMIIESMLSNYGLIEGVDYEAVEIGFDAEALIRGDVDVATGYINNEPFQAIDAGVEVKIFEPSRFGVKSYADVLFTTEEVIESRPDLVKKFVKATLDGWEYAVKNTQEAVELTILYKDPNNEALTYDHQLRLLEVAIPLIEPNPGTKIGEMSLIRWKETYDLLKRFGFIANEFQVIEIYTDKFIGAENI